jgi:hypothetical protein
VVEKATSDNKHIDDVGKMQAKDDVIAQALFEKQALVEELASISGGAFGVSKWACISSLLLCYKRHTVYFILCYIFLVCLNYCSWREQRKTWMSRQRSMNSCYSL